MGWPRVVIAASIGVTLLAGCGAKRPARMGGWVTEWDLERGLQSVSRAPLSDVFFFVARLDPEGMPVFARPGVDYAAAARTARTARASGATVWLTIVNDVVFEAGGRTLKDPETVHRVFHDAALRGRHIAALIDLAVENGFDGIDVDYENVAARDRDVFTLFVGELARAAAARSLTVSVTVQPKVRESRADGPGAADWKALCAIVDRVQVMLYNLHNARTAPGPVATIEWIGRVLDFAESECGRERIVPILKTSGFEWGPDPTRDATFERASSLATTHGTTVARDDGELVPFLSFAVDGKQHSVYFEDAVSLEHKLCYLGSRGFDRVVLWSLGREDPALWNAGADDRRCP